MKIQIPAQQLCYIKADIKHCFFLPVIEFECFNTGCPMARFNGKLNFVLPFCVQLQMINSLKCS